MFSKVPIIILSCTEEPDKVEDAYRRGATLYVRKPASYLDYVGLLRSLLGSEGGTVDAGDRSVKLING